jgi:hypothetical protein
VGVLQLGGKLDLAPEPIHVHAGGQLGEEHLHDNLPVERTLERNENPRHTPASELALKKIGIPQGPLKLLLKAGAHGIAVSGETEI